MFPLRTSVELFARPTEPAAVTRAKEAAVLYERVVFEEGLLDVTVTEDGPGHVWRPRESLTAEDFERSRQPISPGAPVTWGFAVQPARGVPAREEDMVAIESPLVVRYMAEFESGILDELESLAPDWLETFRLPDYAMDDMTRRAIGHLNFQVLGDRQFMVDTPEGIRDYVYKSFNRDAYIAGQRDAAISVTGLFAPMLARSKGIELVSGSQALEVLAPDLGSVPWEAVLDFRAHAASQEAREKFKEYEQRAADQEVDELVDFGTRISQEITSDLLAAVRDFERVQPADIAKEIAKGSVGVLPGVGPFVGAAASALDLAHQADRARTSWRAALMTLRPPYDEA